MSSPLPLDKRDYDRALGCVHCGLCLPACPTYLQTAHEADSPRGRIHLMRGLADGAIAPSERVLKHLDLCLDCRACETACPSGVVYHELLEGTRAALVESRQSPPATFPDFVVNFFLFHIFTRPRRLKLALLPIRLLQRIGVYELFRRCNVFRFLPPRLQKMERMLPATGSLWPMPPPPRTRTGGVSAMLTALHENACHKESRPKAVVALLTGCVGGVLFDDTLRKTVELLTAAGAEVLCPPRQTCCGALHQHRGHRKAAQRLARRNINAFPKADFIVTTMAGCGAMLHEYDSLLRDDGAYRDRAADFSARARDVCEVLAELGLPEMRHAQPIVATYHDACHLAHARHVTAPPRQLLARIPGLRLIPLGESDMCCGAAGSYNLTQPEMASRLADRKLQNIAATGATVCVTGNGGCALHLQSQAAARGRRLKFVHPVDLLHAAFFGR
ncbi:MAG TPA: heterodisulfide reductase-related iron-sulfur binding cluster [Tepidisphaeraceae bacterium]|nr:heterodisulfide reductase-related iron-sulfur binding cluster [Tepidisphaeraceae bacterium]